MKRLLPVIGLLFLAQPALAQTVTDSDFVLQLNDGSAPQSTTIIPLIDGACYEWRLKLAKAKSAVDVTEIFTLPAPPTSWNGVGSNVTISNDKTTATSALQLSPQDGWISHGWCVATGDPVGGHTVVVKVGDKVLGEFPFIVEKQKTRRPTRQ
ncbi:hypothetical protein [Devosia sp. 2618]|uniref:hypothetical protein n=1 Tax=Devosia sp. 2618 TaxID=3156454 RepID=UPI003395C379